eukprot:scaffold1858_cov47-Phaeocystis_antarctica.AAC.2
MGRGRGGDIRVADGFDRLVVLIGVATLQLAHSKLCCECCCYGDASSTLQAGLMNYFRYSGEVWGVKNTPCCDARRAGAGPHALARVWRGPGKRCGATAQSALGWYRPSGSAGVPETLDVKPSGVISVQFSSVGGENVFARGCAETVVTERTSHRSSGLTGGF